MSTNSTEPSIIGEARELMRQYAVFEDLRKYGKVLFLNVSGAHAFGFPSPDSDIDVRGVYICDTNVFLGIRAKSIKTTYKFASLDKKLDVSLDEIGHFFRVLLNANGNRLEWPNSDLVFDTYEGFHQLRSTVNNAAISRKLLHHYLHFARDMWKGKTKEVGVKKDLYTLRTYMEGISIFEDGIVNPDIQVLNRKYDFPIVKKMIEAKQKGEGSGREGYNVKELERIVEYLDQRLIESASKANIREEPDLTNPDTFLIQLRKQY